MRTHAVAWLLVATLTGTVALASLGLRTADGQPAGNSSTPETGPSAAPSPSAPAAVPPAGGPTSPPFDLADPAKVEEGHQQFRVTCAVAYCHGSEGRIGGGAPSLRGRVVGTPDYVFNTIANGRRRMPPWKSALPPEKIWALVAYIKSLETAQ